MDIYYQHSIFIAILIEYLYRLLFDIKIIVLYKIVQEDIVVSWQIFSNILIIDYNIGFSNAIYVYKKFLESDRLNKDLRLNNVK